MKKTVMTDWSYPTYNYPGKDLEFDGRHHDVLQVYQ